VLRRDRDGHWWHESLAGAPMPDWLTSALAAPPAPEPECRIDWVPADREAHRGGVLACLEAIRAGEVYQACVCTQFTGTLTGSPLDFFIDGVARTSPARAAYVAGPWGAVASLSPELFLRRRGAAVMSSPIKGTLPLDAWPSALRASAKEVAENIMIVDLVRNDLGRVAITGTVTVPELLVVRRAPGVWHMVSTVSARVLAELPTSALLAAAFPPASVTGTRNFVPANCFHSGSRTGAGYIAAPLVWLPLLPGASSTWRSGPSSSTQRVAPSSGLAAGSRPTPIPMPNGRNACTRRPRSSGCHPRPWQRASVS